MKDFVSGAILSPPILSLEEKAYYANKKQRREDGKRKLWHALTGFLDFPAPLI
ncbi:MAG: hypothetical protein NWE94_08445 [Candidatus Bathyarchaeota archaeon]|nr:hypothetical protein [Candidatus Bathyarchaeota archaeon]